MRALARLTTLASVLTLASACGQDPFERLPGHAYEFRVKFEDGRLLSFEPLFTPDAPDAQTAEFALNPSLPSGAQVIQIAQDGTAGNPPSGFIELDQLDHFASGGTACDNGGGSTRAFGAVELNSNANVNYTGVQVQVLSATDAGFRLCENSTGNGTAEEGDFGAVSYFGTLSDGGSRVADWSVNSNTGTYTFVGRVVGIPN